MEQSLSMKSSGETENGPVRAESQTTVNENFADRLSAAWGVVEKSRHPQRPYSLDYVLKIFSDFEELRGDRAFGEDLALVGGVGILRANGEFKKDLRVAFLGHQKGRNTKQKIERNFGMAKPEGYRKAMRIFEMAQRFRLPLLTFIDTPGAFPGIGAEERGQSEAIASSILRMFRVEVPTVSVVIGEGGSGGALAIGVADRLLMLQNSTYSVISPESCAAILWGTATESKRAALALKISAKETLNAGICDEIIAEAGAGAHEALDEVSDLLSKRLHWHFNDLINMDAGKRIENRFKKYRYIDGKHVS